MDQFLFSAEDAQIPSPPKSVQDNRISNNVLRSRTLGYRRWLTLGCALLHRRLENVPRLVPDLHGKITTLCSQNVFHPAASQHAATCAHRRTQKNTPLTPPPNRACAFLRPQPSSGSGRCFSHQACRQTRRRKLPAPLSLPHNCQRPSQSFPSLPNLNRTLALLQASGCSICLCSAEASLFTSN